MFKKLTTLFIVVLILTLSAGCATTHHGQGAGAGAVLGGVAGALLDGGNPWRGAVIGAAIGGAAGYTLTDISVRASKEAAASGRPVEYRTQDGRTFHRAEPVGGFHHPDAHTRCRKVHERTWEDGRLVRDNVREVCESTKTERRY